MPYKEYLATPEWHEKRRAAYRRADYRCQLCKASETEIHAHHAGEAESSRPSDHWAYSATMPLSLAQAQSLIAAAHDHAVANGWNVTVAVVDEGGLLVALGRMDGAFPLSPQIAEAKAAGTALWHRDGDRLAASRASHEGFFDAVSRLVRLPLIPGPGSVLIRDGESVLGAAGASGASGDDDRACVEAGLRAVFPGWTPRAANRYD